MKTFCLPALPFQICSLPWPSSATEQAAGRKLARTPWMNPDEVSLLPALWSLCCSYQQSIFLFAPGCLIVETMPNEFAEHWCELGNYFEQQSHYSSSLLFYNTLILLIFFLDSFTQWLHISGQKGCHSILKHTTWKHYSNNIYTWICLHSHHTHIC